MKYIAFPGTYNEQIYDSVEQTITWTNRMSWTNFKSAKNVRPVLNKTWKKLNNVKELT